MFHIKSPTGKAFCSKLKTRQMIQILKIMWHFCFHSTALIQTLVLSQIMKHVCSRRKRFNAGSFINTEQLKRTGHENSIMCLISGQILIKSRLQLCLICKTWPRCFVCQLTKLRLEHLTSETNEWLIIDQLITSSHLRSGARQELQEIV